MPRRYRRRRSYGRRGGGYRRSGGYSRRSYGRRSSFFRTSRRRTAGWRWLLTGIVTGTVVTGMLYINENTLDQTNTNGNNPGLAQKAESEAPKFEFYQLLSKSEQEAAPESLGAGPNLTEQRYLLQVAAFPNKSDALQLKKQVTSWGQKATVVEVDLNGSRWYRV